MLPLVEILTTILLVFIVYFVYYRFENRRIREYLESLPSPPKLPIIGHAWAFKTPTKILQVLHKFTDDYGKVIAINFGPFGHSVIVRDYKFIEFILSTNLVLRKNQPYRYMEPWLGTGLLTAYGHKWKSHRRLITPAFHFKILEEFIDIFNKTSDVLIEKLQRYDGVKSFDIYPYITLCSLDAICESAMGVKVNAQQNDQLPYVRAVKEMTRIVVERGRSALKRLDFLFVFTKDYWLQKSSLKILHDYTDQVVDKRMKDMQNNREKSAEIDDSGVKKKRAFLDLILASTVDGQALTRDEIREEVDTFMFAGHDTTASAMTFAVYCLAQHQDIQAKVYEEQLQLFGNEKNPNITYHDLQNMNYLELVIKEVLRLYPSVPMIGRQTDNDVEYENQIIPKGIQISVFIHGIHRDPEYFPEPDKFQPERFQTVDGRFPYSHLPFSAGSRNCIGQKYAMLEIKSVVSKIVRHFELLPAEPQHEVELAPETVLVAKNGVRIGLKRRK